MSVLLKDGIFDVDTLLAKEFTSFAQQMEKRLSEAVAAQEKFKIITTPDENKDPADLRNVQEVLTVLREAIEAHPGQRNLVHLVDVQKSVRRDLRQLASAENGQADYDEDALDPEEDEVEAQKGSLIISRYLGSSIFDEDGLD
jgi:MFS superfamily sulfate permease-like transporter